MGSMATYGKVVDAKRHPNSSRYSFLPHRKMGWAAHLLLAITCRNCFFDAANKLHAAK
jgi:hypothetical protein